MPLYCSMYKKYGNPDADIVLLQPIGEQDTGIIENELSAIRKLTDRDFYWIGFQVENWNRDLSPWEAPAVFGNDDFGEGAKDTLDEILKYCTNPDKTYYLGGYSLAGLFALWAAYQTAVFSGIAAASPSMWFPGFDKYMAEHELKCDRVYLSLGDKEEKTKNPVMKTVGEKIRAAYSEFETQGVGCILEWNEGNHFKDHDLRMAKGFAWLCFPPTVLQRK